MRYYTRNPKKHRNMNFKQFKVHSSLLIVLIIIIAFNFIIYIFGKRILPIVLNMGEVKIKSEAVKIMNEESVNCLLYTSIKSNSFSL